MRVCQQALLIVVALTDQARGPRIMNRSAIGAELEHLASF